MMRRILAGALMVCFGIALALVLLEAFIRAAGSTDVDGQFSFMGYALHPYVIPVKQMGERIEEYLEVKEWAAVIYDAQVGWTFKPNTERQGGIFTVNGAGIRSRREYAQNPPDDTLRIAIFGDSFTAGEDVNDDESWGQQLEMLLNDAGIKAEVLNFGVSGYGMDQAYLRWQHLGASFAPDIVIFGLQPENLKRNVNVFRQLLDSSRYALPFSKPRFVLEDGRMILVNSPPIPPERLPEVFSDFGQHPLAQHEFHYLSRDAAARWWTSSRLASWIYALLQRDDEYPGYYEADTEGGQLGRAIVDAFAASVMRHDARFIVLHLPLQSHLRRYHSDFPPPEPPYHHLLVHSRAAYHYIAMEEQLDSAFVDNAFWTGGKHYGPAIHALVARTVAQELMTCLSSGACPVSRLGDTFSAGSDA